MQKHIAALIITILMLQVFSVLPGSQTEPVLWVDGTLTVSDDCPNPDGYLRSHSYYVSNGSAISAILESCAYINSFALSHLLYNGHDYADESSILISEYEVVITFGVI